MGAFTQAVQSAPNVLDGRRHCGVCDWVATLDDEDLATLEDLLRRATDKTDRSMNIAAAHRYAKKGGLALELPRFYDHVNGKCDRG